ncbi:MAG: sporulation protein, partial [Clostridiales bacterium]|nr:sporulation protein [Clostridiales bacterium]
GIGTAAFIVIAILAAIPILELCVYVLLYQGTAAILQPVSDSRMTDSLSGICEGTKLLLRCVITAAILFMITIAIICATTNSIF